MTTIIKAATEAEFLSLVPHLVGYTPTRSLVLIPFAAGRTLGAFRLDLPGEAEAGGLDRVAATATGMVCRLPDADGVAIVLYSDDAISDGALPGEELAGALLRRLDACGLESLGALCVTPAGWGSYLDPECPPQGRPLELLTAPAEAATMPVAEGDQSTGAELPEPAPAELADVVDAHAALVTALGAVCDGPSPGRSRPRRRGAGRPGARTDRAGAARVHPQALDALCRLDDLPALYEAALQWNPAALAPFDAAVLVLCLSRPGMRDVALVQWCGCLDDGAAALDAQLRWEEGEDYPQELGMQLWGEGVRPDSERLRTALDLTRHIAALSPRGLRPGPLALCGWLSWALGRSTHAAWYAQQAMDIDPDHGLSEIVMSFVATGHIPDWAFLPSAVSAGAVT